MKDKLQGISRFVWFLAAGGDHLGWSCGEMVVGSGRLFLTELLLCLTSPPRNWRRADLVFKKSYARL